MDGKTPTISVVMAVRQGSYAREAVQSILAQTFGDFELIAVNNGGGKNVSDMLASFSDARIRVIENTEDVGLTKALNQGLHIVRGMYVARMDDDDISLPERFTKQKEFLDTHPAVAGVGTAIELIDGGGNIGGRKAALEDPALLRFRALTLNQFVHPSMMVRKDALIAAGGYDEDFRYTQDYELWSRFLFSGQVLSNINLPLLRYRVHATSATQGALSKDEAYRLAMKTTRRNMEHYMPMRDAQFETFCRAFYRDQVGSITDLVTVWKLWINLARSYIRKEAPALQAAADISRYARAQQHRALRWYLRRRFSTLMRIASRIKHLRT